MTRKEATRLKNQNAIQAIVDGAVEEKEDDWNAILSLKFDVREGLILISKDMGFNFISEIRLCDPLHNAAGGDEFTQPSRIYDSYPCKF